MTAFAGWSPDVEPDADLEPELAPACPMCGGPGMVLGALGRLAWYRCRDCGIDFNLSEPTVAPADAPPWPPEEA